MAKMGRPKIPKKEHTVMVSLRLKPETIQQMNKLAKEWQCSKAEVVKRTVEAFAKTLTV